MSNSLDLVSASGAGIRIFGPAIVVMLLPPILIRFTWAKGPLNWLLACAITGVLVAATFNGNELSRYGSVGFVLTGVTALASYLVLTYGPTNEKRQIRNMIQLGIITRPLDEDFVSRSGLLTNHGAIIVSVQPGSLSDKAGFLGGDVILSLDSKMIPPTKDGLQGIVSKFEPGQRVTATVMRNGSIVSTEVNL